MINQQAEINVYFIIYRSLFVVWHGMALRGIGIGVRGEIVSLT